MVPAKKPGIATGEADAGVSASDSLLGLLWGMLEYDPALRLTAEQCLRRREIFGSPAPSGASASAPAATSSGFLRAEKRGNDDDIDGGGDDTGDARGDGCGDIGGKSRRSKCSSAVCPP